MDYNQLANILKAMAHPARLQMLDMLRQGELCVCHIENALDKRQAYVSQQLMVLREAGIVDSRRDGLQVYYRITDSHVIDLMKAIYGTADSLGYQPIDGCQCPRCAVVALTEVH
jgi:DNA-binding transcriptional ArsR family regulator